MATGVEDVLLESDLHPVPTKRAARAHDFYGCAACVLPDRINEKQAAKIRALQEQAKRDKEELARLEMAAALNGSDRDKSAARAQVNRLLREVDKCIALVSDRI